MMFVMDINKMLDELRSERALIEEAIVVLARLSQGQKRRGRPPVWMSQMEGAEPRKRRGRPPGSKNKPKEEPPPEE